MKWIKTSTAFTKKYCQTELLLDDAVMYALRMYVYYTCRVSLIGLSKKSAKENKAKQC